MKKFFSSLALLTAAFVSAKAGEKYSFHVAADEISNGYIVKRIWLSNYARPQISITGTSFKNISAIPANSLPSSPDKFDLQMGMEQKRPFALVRIPAYMNSNGLKELTDVSLDVTENLNSASNPQFKTAHAANSVLASGNWYKIAVSNTGIVKLDFDFLSKLGVDPSSISPANIRVFGYGGNMLSEDNAKPKKDDLAENAIYVNDGGDGHFDKGDYVLFYGLGPMTWTADLANGKFHHTKNLYTDKGYYFLNFDAPGKRIGVSESLNNSTVSVNSFSDYAVHEEDLSNPVAFGKIWWGEKFDVNAGTTSQSFNFNLGQVIGDATVKVAVASVSDASSNVFNVSFNGQALGTCLLGHSAVNSNDDPITGTEGEWQVSTSGGNVSVGLNYKAGQGSGIVAQAGYLGYIEINMRKALSITDASLLFRDLSSVGSGNIASFQVGNANSSTQIWDVTDPQNPVLVRGTLNGSTYTFNREASTLHEYAAINNSQVNTPDFIGKVANQNLHGLDFTDFIIVTHPDFISAANDLADFHRQHDNMKVIVVTVQDIYNEFSSGAQDISAIRDFVKMFYDRAGTDITKMPKNLLLFGDASYDYKDRLANNTNYVPTYEDAESYNIQNNYCNDDFFAFLDDSENINNMNIANALDVGVGRLPVASLSDANAMVNKIKEYKSAASLGPWRVSTTLIADNEDEAGPHMSDGEIMDSVIQTNSKDYNATKVYLDATKMVSTPGGLRAPDANKEIDDQVYKGTLLLNYNGHGNDDVLAHERIVTQDDYTKWNDIHQMPFMVTATCEFGRYDQPTVVSAGERIILKNNGGAIASLTTVQQVYQGSNQVLNRDFLNAQFKRNSDGHYNSFGEAFRLGKNVTYSSGNGDLVNFRKFALLGDPALTPDMPMYNATADSVIDAATMKPTDTVSALGAYIVKGRVRDLNGNVMTDFNGRLSVTFFDKPHTVNVVTYFAPKSFKVNNSIIYKGKATVTNGEFSFSFIAPKDINYEIGKGKISLYGENGETDGAGFDTTYKVGGYSDNPVIENNPPIVMPYIGDTLFISGGITGPNTLLYVKLKDETGINVSGNGVGHDLIAVLDDNIESPYVLNDYYETDPNTYKTGFVSYPLYNLPEGKHRLTVKAWDVNNNSGTGYVDFEVVNGNVVKVQHLLNYPNPFRDVTHFVFEHNHPDETLNTEINIYNTSGVPVRNLKESFLATGSRSNEIVWDGTDNNGAKLPAGVYLYRVKIATEKGIQTLAYQKIVLLR